MILQGIGILVIVFLCIYLSGLKKKYSNLEDRYTTLNQQRIEQVKYNHQQEQSNRALEQENRYLQKKKDEIIEGIKAQDNILKSLTATAAQARADAESLAQQAYEAKERELQDKLKEAKDRATADYNKQLSTLAAQKLEEEQKLKDLENKQLAYLEAERRKQEMEANQDFYKLQLSPEDESDIKILRDIEGKIGKKDAIDKVIYEVYYRPAFNALAGRVITKEKLCGIYRITSSIDGLSYIGQSVDIKERWRQHIKNGLAFNPGNNQLYQALRKQEPQSFTFEVLEEVERAKLNERETYWIDFYKTKDFGLNSTKGGS